MRLVFYFFFFLKETKETGKTSNKDANKSHLNPVNDIMLYLNLIKVLCAKRANCVHIAIICWEILWDIRISVCIIEKCDAAYYFLIYLSSSTTR